MKTGYAFRRPVANTYLVRERSQRRWRDLGIVLLFVAPVGLSLLAYASVHVRVLELGLEITTLEGRLDSRQDEERRLRREAASLASPARLEGLVGDMGLVHPRVEQVLFAEEEL